MHSDKRLENTLGSTSAFTVSSYLIETEDYAIAASTTGEIGITWNKSAERKNGFPHSYSNQQWFIVPDVVADLIRASVSIQKFKTNQLEKN